MQTEPAEKLLHPPTILLIGVPREHVRISETLTDRAIVVTAPSLGSARAWLQVQTQDPPHGDPCLKLSELEIDPARHVATWNGVPLHLTEQEFRLLALLVEWPGRAFSYAELLSRVWGVSFSRRDAPARSAIKRLRRKLAEVGAAVEIESVWGYGVRMSVRQDDASRGEVRV